jgi:CheY-like chemotaxis protein
MKRKLKCILLIDDDEPTNFLSMMLIKNAACAEHIEVAQSGQAALDYLSTCEERGLCTPDLVFLDINMPAMNGWEFLEKYNALGHMPQDRIVLVMLTTSLNPDDKQKADDIPVISGFESKPLTVGKLELVLKSFFPANFEPVSDQLATTLSIE